MAHVKGTTSNLDPQLVTTNPIFKKWRWPFEDQGLKWSLWTRIVQNGSCKRYNFQSRPTAPGLFLVLRFHLTGMYQHGWEWMAYDGLWWFQKARIFNKNKNSQGGVLRGLIGHVPKNIQKYTRGGSLHMSAPYLDKKCFIKSFYNPGLPALCQRTQSTRYKFKTIGSDLTTSYNQELCSRTGSIFLSSLCSLHRGFLTQLH